MNPSNRKSYPLKHLTTNVLNMIFYYNNFNTLIFIKHNVIYER